MSFGREERAERIEKYPPKLCDFPADCNYISYDNFISFRRCEDKLGDPILSCPNSVIGVFGKKIRDVIREPLLFRIERVEPGECVTDYGFTKDDVYYEGYIFWTIKVFAKDESEIFSGQFMSRGSMLGLGGLGTFLSNDYYETYVF